MYSYVTIVSSPHLHALPFFCWKYIYYIIIIIILTHATLNTEQNQLAIKVSADN